MELEVHTDFTISEKKNHNKNIVFTLNVSVEIFVLFSSSSSKNKKQDRVSKTNNFVFLCEGSVDSFRTKLLLTFF